MSARCSTARLAAAAPTSRAGRGRWRARSRCANRRPARCSARSAAAAPTVARPAAPAPRPRSRPGSAAGAARRGRGALDAGARARASTGRGDEPLVREAGSTQPKATGEIAAAIAELRCGRGAGGRSRRAGVLPTRRAPARSAWPSACRSASSARSRPGTCRCCSRCARSRRRWRSATRSCSSPTRTPRSAAAPCSPSCSRRGRPARRRLHARRSAAPTTGEALVTDPRVDMISFTGSTAVGTADRRARRRAAEEGRARARRQQPVDRARRRRPRPGQLRRRLGLVPAPGPDLHGGLAPPRARVASPRSTSSG